MSGPCLWATAFGDCVCCGIAVVVVASASACVQLAGGELGRRARRQERQERQEQLNNAPTWTPNWALSRRHSHSLNGLSSGLLARGFRLLGGLASARPRRPSAADERRTKRRPQLRASSPERASLGGQPNAVQCSAARRLAKSHRAPLLSAPILRPSSSRCCCCSFWPLSVCPAIRGERSGRSGRSGRAAKVAARAQVSSAGAPASAQFKWPAGSAAGRQPL